MPETTFWKPNNSTILNKPKPAGKGFGKKLGVGGGIVFGLVAAVAGVVFFFIVRPFLAITPNINALKSDQKILSEALTNRNVDEMEAALNKTEKDLKELRTARDSSFGWAKNFSPTKTYYMDSERFINAGVYLVESARETVKLVMPFADAAGLKGTKKPENAADTGLKEAFAAWVAVMPQVAADMDPVLANLDKAGKELKLVDARKYPESVLGTPIRSNIEAAQDALGSVGQYGPDIKKALTVVPNLLGVNGTTKRYMIIMQNDKEIRATGGFWTNYATFKVTNGMLDSDFTSADMYSIDLALDDIDAWYTFPTVPAEYNKYLKVERLYARDANISPDFPTAVEKFMGLYKMAIPLRPAEIKAVDGVIAIDTNVISELLKITGPVTVNGFTYDSENVVLELEKVASLELREQSGRKKVLGDLMDGMLNNVFQSDKNLWSQLIEKGVDLAIKKHIIAFVNDVEAQALVEEYNLGGRIIDPVEGDFSFVVSTNLGGDKTNWFVKKAVDHTLTKEGNRYVDTIKITYSYPDPDGVYAPFVKRFRDWVRVYAPLNSEIINVTGSEDGSKTDQERNKTYFTGYIELGPTETKEMTFKYYLPEGAVKNGTYNLYLEKQPGTNGEVHKVTVNGKTETITLDHDVKISKKL